MPTRHAPRSRHPVMRLQSRAELQITLDRLILERNSLDQRCRRLTATVRAGALRRFLFEILEQKGVRSITFRDNEAVVVLDGSTLEQALTEYLVAKGFDLDLPESP